MSALPSRRLFLRSALGSVTASALTAASYRRVSGANERIGVGFIGYGLNGKRHVEDFRREADVDLTAMAEVHKGRLDEGRAALGGRAAAAQTARVGHRARRCSRMSGNLPDSVEYVRISTKRYQEVSR